VSLSGPFFLPMRSYTAIAIEKLAHLVQHAKSEQACIAAASELLSRGWGKPTQPIAGDDEMSPGSAALPLRR
jgi:hypothetical protein